MILIHEKMQAFETIKGVGSVVTISVKENQNTNTISFLVFHTPYD